MMSEPSHVSISVLFRKQEPKRFIGFGSLRGGVPLKKRLKKPPDLLGSVLPKCAHSLRTQDQGAGTGSSKGLELQKKEEKTTTLISASVCVKSVSNLKRKIKTCRVQTQHRTTLKRNNPLFLAKPLHT